MFFSRLPEHRKEEIDQIATLLTAWTASRPVRKTLRRQTNISLTGKIAHFELGYIPEQAVELKTAAGLLISGFTRQHIITLPRALWKRIIFEEVARFLDVPGGEKIMGEGYAQLRKFNCWIISIVQQYSKFKSTRIRPVIMGNSKQFFLMRQFDRSDLEDISKDIQLPEVMIDAVQHYPLPEQQAANQKFSSLCYYSPTVQPPSAERCATSRKSTPTPPKPYENPILSPSYCHPGSGALRLDLQPTRPRRDRRSQDRLQPRTQRCRETAILDGSEPPEAAQGAAAPKVTDLPITIPGKPPTVSPPSPHGNVRIEQ
jgi:hypothetical protein